MEILGGFMVMASILGFFLTVIWFVLPFVIFSIKGKVDRTLLLLEEADRRLATMEAQLIRLENQRMLLQAGSSQVSQTAEHEEEE